jgi:uncharacterized protein (TIGR00299 family) protein
MIVDCQLSGVSGDMIIGALLGVGANERKVVSAIESVKKHVDWCRGINVKVSDVMKKEIKAKDIQIDIKEDTGGGMKGRTASQIRTAVSETVSDSNLSDQARKFALAAIDTLLEAESRVHGRHTSGDVELSELGSTDTVADIVGAATALDDLGIFLDTTVYSTPVAVGGGLFRFSHGMFQSPGPVVLEILRKFSFPMVGGPVEAELATPTGVSLLVNMVNWAEKFYPDLRPQAVGYGAGKFELGEVPNVLRIVLGNPTDHELLSDRVVVLETNLDDVDGETVGFLMDRLISEDVRDVCVVPVMMKKSRPGQILKVIVGEGDVARISRMIIDETGSLGVRRYPVERYVVSREVVSVELPIGSITRTVRIKVAKSKSGEIINLKPEYEDVKSISLEGKKPFREVEEIIRNEAKQKLLGEDTKGNDRTRTRPKD